VIAAVAGAQGAPGTSAPGPGSAAERQAIETCLAIMPAAVQVAVGIVEDGSARFMGAERAGTGTRWIDNRSAVFQIGSITKVFTATLLAQSVVAGRMNLDDAVADRLPFRLKASGKGGVEMTLGQVASHTSGIALHQPPGSHLHALLHFHPDEPWRDYDSGRFEAYLREDLELKTVPGTAYHYSNIGMSLLGLIVSLQSDAPYEALLQERIFRPFGMRASTTSLALVRERVVPGLKVNGNPFPNQAMAALAPSGGIYSSAEDMARFARAQIEGRDPAVVLSQRPMFTIAEGERVALGWHVYDWAQGWRTLNHNGAIGGYTASVTIDTASRRAVVVLSNVMNEGEHGEAVRALGRALLKQIEPPSGRR
jgi:CubicO group peptidase (beta-lactamase class C family)